MKNQNQKTILLVEDDSTSMMVETHLLQSFGYDVVTAKSGEEAVQIATGNDKIDLILMDINLGSGIDGTEAAKQILLKRNLPIVFFSSSHAEKEYVERIKGITGYGYVMKNSDKFVIQSSIEMAFELFKVVKTLQESEERFRAIVENAPFGYYRVGKDGLWQYVNPVWEQMHSLSLKEIIGKPFEITQPKDSVEEAREIVKRVLTGETIVGEFSRLTRDGNIEYHSFNIQPVKQGKEIVAIEGFINDITERKKTEEELRENERKIRALFDQTFQFIGMMTPDGTLIEANRTAMQFLGINESDCLGKPFWDTPWWTHSAEMQNKLREAVIKVANGETVRFEATHPAADGSIHYIDFSLKPVKDETGKIVFLIPEGRDITEHKKTEETLRESESRYRTLFDRASDGIVIMAVDGKGIKVNESFARMHGYSPQEIAHMSLQDLDTPETFQLAPERLRRLMAGEALTFEVEHHHKDGHSFPLSVSCNVVQFEGQSCFLGFHRDITEHKRAELALREGEDRFRLLYESSPIGIEIYDADGRLTHANPATLAIFGVTSEDLVIGFNLFADPNISDKHKAMILRGETVKYTSSFNFEKVREQALFPTTRQGIIELDVMIQLITGGRGYQVLVNDITDRKLAQEKLLASERLAVMGRLVADVSHEANNPLTIILGGTEFMLSHLDKKSSLFKKQLETVLRNAKRCKTIFANLLGYNRTIGKQEETVKLPALIREAIEGVGYQYDMSGIETVFNEIANAEITGNSTALLSVFINLIRNARQAMGEKGRLTITMQKEDNKYLRIEIHDTGSGMNAKQKAELFKPFASGWKERDGSGLGLATSLGIIETHGGSMSAESAGVGKGATFTILLPCEFKDKKG